MTHIPDSPRARLELRLARERIAARIEATVLAVLAGVSAAFILGCIINPAAVAALIGITP